MSGPYGPNDAPGSGEGRANDPTQQWGGQQQPGQGHGSADPTQQWGGQQPSGQQPGGQQQWAPPQQGQQQPQQGQPQWGQQSQPSWPQQGQPQQGQPQPGQPQWGQQSQPSWPQQQPPQSQPWEATQQQWGQQPQQGQPQWGQQPGQQWGQQPGQQQWSSEPQLDLVKPKKAKKFWFIGGGVVAVLVVVGVVLGFIFLSGDKLDNKAVQDGVQKVLKDSYGIDDVQGVSCPSGQKVKVGSSFDCSLKVGGESKTVTVKVTKDDGTYEVGRPN